MFGDRCSQGLAGPDEVKPTHVDPPRDMSMLVQFAPRQLQQPDIAVNLGLNNKFVA